MSYELTEEAKAKELKLMAEGMQKNLPGLIEIEDYQSIDSLTRIDTRIWNGSEAERYEEQRQKAIAARSVEELKKLPRMVWEAANRQLNAIHNKKLRQSRAFYV